MKIVIMICITMILVIAGCSNTFQDYSLDWACMDGCYGMLNVIYDEVDYGNETLEGYHTECTNICHDKHLK